MSYSVSLVVICPAALKPAASALAAAIGWGGDNLGVALSADGSEPATHYGLYAWATPEIAAVFRGETQIEAPGFAPEQIDAVRAQLAVSTSAEFVKRAHFQSVLSSAGLVRVGG